MKAQFKNSWVMCLLGLVLVSGSAHAEMSVETNQPIPLRLLAFNVWQFAYGIESTNNEERADKLAQIISQKHDKFDVIGFEEMWSNVTRSQVYSQIEALYPYHFEDNQWGAVLGIGFTSGLAIYSKYPIVRQMLYTYKNYRGSEDLAKKGLIGVELNVQGKTVYVFDTHLQAGDGGAFFRWIDCDKPSTTEIAALQLLEAKEQINEFVREKNAPIFLMGDFNITAGSEEYQKDVFTFGSLIDTFDPSKSEFQGSDLNHPEVNNRIDYIFTIGKQVPGYSIVTGEFGGPKEVSDHRAVTGTFDISSF